MPTVDELPRGARRDFTLELFHLFKLARRPTMQMIADRVATLAGEEALATASRETVRRMLTGATVPSNWNVVDVVMAALCDLAGVTPTSERYPGDMNEGATDIRTAVEDAWNRALDGDEPREAVWGDGPPF